MTFQRIYAVAVGLVGCAVPLWAQEPVANWSRLGELPPGVRLTVTTRDSRRVEGYLAGISNAQLDMKSTPQGPVTETFAPPGVVEVSRSVSMTKNGALIGLLVGAAAAGMGHANRAHPGYGNVAGATAVVFGGSGAAIGALIGASRHKAEVIYRAP